MSLPSWPRPRFPQDFGLQVASLQRGQTVPILPPREQALEKGGTKVYKRITDGAAETADSAKLNTVGSGPSAKPLPPAAPLHPHPNRSSDLCLGWAPGHFPGGEFPRALGGSPKRIQDTAAGNVERIFKSEGEAMSLCQISGLDPGLRNGGAFPLADSRCSSRCGYGNKINDG